MNRITNSAFEVEPFRPARLLASPHTQTILANTLRSVRGLFFRRVRLDTPDGDFLDIDFPVIPGVSFRTNAPLVLLLHGLEGHARRSYACETYRQLARFGIRAVGMNYRSCSGEVNRLPRLYHSGATDDVLFVINWLTQRFPTNPLGAVGFSLGGNLLIKYLGEAGDQTPLQAAAVVSPPFDLRRSAESFENGNGRIYARGFIKSLRQKVQNHAHIIGEKVNLDCILEARTLREFDEALTAPLHGFRDANDYYAQCSSGQFISAVRIPTLIIRALDDPFFAHDIPQADIANNPYLFPALTQHGGHVAFFEGAFPGKLQYWAERQAARFLMKFLPAGFDSTL